VTSTRTSVKAACSTIRCGGSPQATARRGSAPWFSHNYSFSADALARGST
jgi:hypothetical protein